MDEKRAVDTGTLGYFHAKLGGEFATPSAVTQAIAAAAQYTIATEAELTAGRVALTIAGDVTQNMTIRFAAPCNSEDITVGISINGMLFQWLDSAGTAMLGVYQLFGAGATVDILVDRNNLIAYYVTAEPVPYIIEYPAGQAPAYRIPGRVYWECVADVTASTEG